jgi:WD40 repeat protein
MRVAVWIGLTGALLGASTGCAPAASAPPVEVVASLPATTPPAPPPVPGTAAAGAAPVCPARRLIGNIAFAPDGESLLSACASGQVNCATPDNADVEGDHFVDVWDLRQGRLARSLDTGMSSIVQLAWGPGGRLATVADPTTGMGEVRLFDVASWALRRQTQVYCIQSVDFTPSGSALAIAGADGQIQAIDLKSGKITRRPEKEAHIGGDVGIAIRFTPDGKTLAVADESAGFQVLNASTLRQRAAASHASRPACSAFSANGSLLATMDEAGSLDVIETRDPRRRRRLSSDPDHGCAAMTWLDARRFAVALGTGELAIWEASGSEPPRPLRGPAAVALSTLSADPSATTLASVDAQGAVVLWDVATSAVRRELRAGIPPAAGSTEVARASMLAWSPRGDRLAAFVRDRFLAWEAATFALVAEIPSPGDAARGRTLAWRADGQVLAVADDTARLVRMADRAVVTLSVFAREGQRLGLVAADSGAYAGPPELAACATRSGLGRSARTELRPGLLADFFAGRPVGIAP